MGAVYGYINMWIKRAFSVKHIEITGKIRSQWSTSSETITSNTFARFREKKHHVRCKLYCPINFMKMAKLWCLAIKNKDTHQEKTTSVSALPTSNSACVLFHTCTLTTYCKHMRERRKWKRGKDSCMLQILLTGVFFSLSLRPSGCCISYSRKFQDPSLVITDSNSYMCPDETIFWAYSY